MKATEAKLLDVIRKAPQFVIPIYQRTYAWTERECRQLWDDIQRAGREESISVHFIGSVVYVEDGLSQVSDQAPLLVIDGQQRLTTITLLLTALRDTLAPEDEPQDGFSIRKIDNRYLLDPDEVGERRFKLLLSQTDRTSLKAIVERVEASGEPSVAIYRNYEFFRDLIRTTVDNLPALCRGLSKLVVVDVALSRENDNPQLIFESMNSTGRQLSQADLIRNFVLMGLAPDEQTRLYEQFWRPMEQAFGQDAYGEHFDSFMRHYLTYRTGTIPRIGDVYEAFKDFTRDKPVVAAGTEAMLRDLRNYARYYCRMELGAETDAKLADAFRDLRDLKVDTAYPFLLELYGDHERGDLTRDEMLTAVRMIEAYVFRRVICAIPTNTLNKTFAGFGRALRKDRYLESIAAHFLTLKTYRRFPGDDEFQSAFVRRDLYNTRQRSFCLRKLENQGRKERVPLEDYTIEHILPQNEALSPAWREALGPDWQRVRETWLHSVGNLTLTGYNSEYSDRPFPEKRDMEGGFAQSPLKLNIGLGQLLTWNEASILERGERLAKRASAVWPAPHLDADVVSAYEQSAEIASAYTLADHPALAGTPTRELFDTYRREILALDGSVVEQVRKLYIAYKAETNFTDVVPQAGGLRLSFNMPFSELVDPHGLCKDVSEVGRWGNGEVELKVTRADLVPYAVGIARQALERQLGGVEQPDF